MAVPKDQIQKTALNSYHSKLQFSEETEANRALIFLDLLVFRQPDATLITNWYRKCLILGFLHRSHT